MKKPNEFEKMMVSNILVIDIAHISEQDNHRLLTGCLIPECVGICFTLEDCGFLIQPFPKMKKKDLKYFKPNGFTKAIGKIILYAQSNGCDFIKLEPDAECVTDLKTYNW